MGNLNLFIRNLNLIEFVNLMIELQNLNSFSQFVPFKIYIMA